MEKKITNKEMYAIVHAIVEAVGIPEGVESSATPEEILTWIEYKTEQLDRKATTVSKAQKAKNEANEKARTEILNILKGAAEEDETEDFKGLPANVILSKSEVFDGLTPQKITYLLRKMVDDGLVVKTKVDKKMHYAAV